MVSLARSCSKVPIVLMCSLNYLSEKEKKPVALMWSLNYFSFIKQKSELFTLSPDEIVREREIDERNKP